MNIVEELFGIINKKFGMKCNGCKNVNTILCKYCSIVNGVPIMLNIEKDSE